MKFIHTPLSKKDISVLKKKYGDYLKLTIDLVQETIMAGCPLHADGESFLLRRSSSSKNIWGGGINLQNKIIDTIAVLNLRPNLNNNSMEILDQKRRDKFIKIVRKIFVVLWS